MRFNEAFDNLSKLPFPVAHKEIVHDEEDFVTYLLAQVKGPNVSTPEVIRAA